jgi:hypothetical protein
MGPLHMGHTNMGHTNMGPGPLHMGHTNMDHTNMGHTHGHMGHTMGHTRMGPLHMGHTHMGTWVTPWVPHTWVTLREHTWNTIIQDGVQSRSSDTHMCGPMCV